jgi:DNA-binding NtrC family response regulator
MSKKSAIERRTPITGTLTVLSVSPLDEDHSSLQAIIGHSKWLLFKARDLISTLALLEREQITVLLCEQNLLTGTWRDVLEHLNAMPQAPSLIVTSKFADDRLWGEALNLGAWDVLAKPFDHIEVIRSIKSAWQRWHDQFHMRATAVTMIEAAS